MQLCYSNGTDNEINWNNETVLFYFRSFQFCSFYSLCTRLHICLPHFLLGVFDSEFVWRTYSEVGEQKVDVDGHPADREAYDDIDHRSNAGLCKGPLCTAPGRRSVDVPYIIIVLMTLSCAWERLFNAVWSFSALSRRTCTALPNFADFSFFWILFHLLTY